MKSNRKVPFPIFLLVSALLNLVFLEILFTNIKPDSESLDSSEERTYIELVEIPILKETEPPDKPERLAEKSHKAEEETTRDDTTKLSKSYPAPPKRKTEQGKSPKLPQRQLRRQTETFSPEKDEVALMPEVEVKENRSSKEEVVSNKLPQDDPEDSTSKIFNPEIIDVPYDYNTTEQLMGTKDVERKEITVDLNTTEYKYISYFTKLKERIYQVWKYPNESQARREQGNTRIVFVLRKDGYLESVRILRSSGFDDLDEEVLRTIRVASPYYPFPKSWEEEKLRIPATFNYKLPTWVRYYN